MKRCFFLVLLLVAAGCVTGKPRIFTEDFSGRMISVKKGEIFEIALPSNPTTGYRWEVLPSGCSLIGKDFEVPEERRGLCGAGGTERFLFRADSAEPCELRLVYRRSWEKVPPEKVFSLRIEATK